MGRNRWARKMLWMSGVIGVGVLIGVEALAQEFGSGADVPALAPHMARAQIVSCVEGKQVSGYAVLQEAPSAEGVKQVDVTVVVSGLSDGKHAVHIHEVGRCDAATRCNSAGGHFDPGPSGNSMVDANHPFHAGDLQNIDVQRGQGQLQTRTTRVSLGSGPLSLFDADGSAIMIHDRIDTYCPNGNEPGCAGATRAACGVLQRIR